MLLVISKVEEMPLIRSINLRIYSVKQRNSMNADYPKIGSYRSKSGTYIRNHFVLWIPSAQPDDARVAPLGKQNNLCFQISVTFFERLN